MNFRGDSRINEGERGGLGDLGWGGGIENFADNHTFIHTYRIQNENGEHPQHRDRGA